MKSLSGRTLLLVAIGVMMVGFAGCSRSKEKPETRLLAILPLTGNLAVIGTPKREAMQLAVESAAKLYPDVRFTVEFQDSQGNAKEAVSALNQALALKKPDFLFIDMTPIVDATLPIIDSNGILTFAGSAQAGITKRSESLFRVFPGGDQEIRLLVEHLKSREYSGLFVLHPNELYGRSIAAEFARIKDDVKFVGADEYALSDKDFRVQLAKARDSGADVIALFGYGSEYAAILRQAQELGIPSDRFVANLGAVNIGVIQLPADMTEGMVFAGPAFALRSHDSYAPQQELVAAYKQKFNKEPDFRVAFVYDSILMLVQAINESEGTAAVPSRLKAMTNYEGTSGRIHMTAERDAEVDLVLGRYTGGKPVHLVNP
jgi:branched-chain amino acid transport system substrate-binding protein